MSNSKQIDEICDRFEAAWKSGEEPSLRAAMEGIPEEDRSALAKVLIPLDVECRAQFAAAPDASDYVMYGDVAVDVAAVALCEISSQTAKESDSPGNDETVIQTADDRQQGDEADGWTNGPGETLQEPKSNESATQFGDYELIEEIARGGMGIVYKARHQKLNRIVALKVILSGKLAGSEELQRFQIEAQAAAKLNHPGIVPVYEIGEHDGQPWLSMAYVEGRSLADAVRDAPLSPRDAVGMTKKITEAIAFAHDQGIIHRDLKPANVLLDAQGEPTVTDFGLARWIDEDSGLTQTGAVMGTPSYMAPEQASGRTHDVGPLSDVYSIGAILYRIVTGRPPFQSSNVVDTLRQVTDLEPVSPALLNPEIDEDVTTICLRCLEKDAAKRPPDAHYLAEEFARYLNGVPILSRQPSVPERIQKWCLRNRAESALFAMILLVIMLGGILFSVVGLPQLEAKLGTDTVSQGLFVLCFLGPMTSLGRLLGFKGVRALELAAIRIWKNCVFSIYAAMCGFVAFVFIMAVFIIYRAAVKGVPDESNYALLAAVVFINAFSATCVQVKYGLKPRPVWLWGILAIAMAVVVLMASVPTLEGFPPLEWVAMVLFFIFGAAVSAFNTYGICRVVYGPAHHYAKAVRRTFGWVPWPFSRVEGEFRVLNVLLLTNLFPLAILIGAMQMTLSIALLLIVLPIWLVEQLRNILLPDSPMLTESLGYLVSFGAFVTLVGAFVS